MKISGNSFCPCGSLKKYKKCCRLFHFGETPLTALELMKSRYSAYVANNQDYIISTTHRDNAEYTTDIQGWKDSINNFSKYSDFRKLEIFDFIDGQEVSYVTFKATIFQGAIDSSFVEKSKFLKVDGRWLYHSGEFVQ